MHVLVIPSWFPSALHASGGYFYEQLRALKEDGCTVGVVYPERHSLRHLTPAALTTHRFQVRWSIEHGLPVLRKHNWNVRSRLPGTYAARIQEATQLAERYANVYGPPDLVHAMSAQWAGAAAVRIGEAWNRPVALTEHFSGFVRETLLPEQRFWARRAFAQADAVGAVSPMVRGVIQAKWRGPSSMRIIPNFVDTDFFDIPQRASPPPLRFVTVGRLVPEKGMDVLLKAFAQAFEDTPSVELHIGGDGPEAKALQHTAQQKGIASQVKFHGHISGTEVRSLLYQAHVFVLPSRYETFGITVLEALATGCPVLATRCGGPEYTVTEQTGSLVAPNSVSALAAGLRRMQHKHDQYVPETLRASLHNRFDRRTFVRQTKALYREAMASYKGRAF